MRYRLIIGWLISINFILISCGPSANELESRRVSDSTLMADSLLKNPSLAQNVDLNTKTPADRKFIKTAELKFKVNNVLSATEKIEDFTAKYGGYLTYSNLQNTTENYKNSRISRDSLLISKQIVVVNQIQLRIPNERLDSFIRELNAIVVFFDYRVIKLSDVTLQFIANQKKTDRLLKYEQRQSQHIDSKPGKLKETSTAEEKLLDKQNQSDDIQLQSLALNDQVKYCNLTIDIYQKPIIIKEVIADFEYVSDIKPSFVIRIWDSLVQGWWILEEIILFFMKIWGIALVIIGTVFGLKYLSKLYKKIK